MAYNNGGAPTAVWGWILACSMTMTVVSTLLAHIRLGGKGINAEDPACADLQDSLQRLEGTSAT